MAGVPFEPVARLATPATAAAARELLVRQTEFARAKSEVEHRLPRRDPRFSEELFRAWRNAIRTGTIPPPGDPPSRAFAVCECRPKELHRIRERRTVSLPASLLYDAYLPGSSGPSGQRRCYGVRQPASLLCAASLTVTSALG